MNNIKWLDGWIVYNERHENCVREKRKIGDTPATYDYVY